MSRRPHWPTIVTSDDTTRLTIASVWLDDGQALHDRIGSEFTLISLRENHQLCHAAPILCRVWRAA